MLMNAVRCLMNWLHCARILVRNAVHLFLTIAGENDRIQGVGHGNQINGMKIIGDSLYTCGIDDSVKQVDIVSNSYTSADIKLGSQPRSMDVKGDTIVTGSVKEVSNAADCILRLPSTCNEGLHHSSSMSTLSCAIFSLLSSVCFPLLCLSSSHSLDIFIFEPLKGKILSFI